MWVTHMVVADAGLNDRANRAFVVTLQGEGAATSATPSRDRMRWLASTMLDRGMK